MSMIKSYDPFSLPLWDPAAFFRDDFLRLEKKGENFIGAKIEWKETPEAHTLKAEVPGLKKDEVKVEVLDGSMLKISGERRIEREEKGEKWHRVERSCGMFVNMFRLPENSRVDKMISSFHDGVLTVTVPKGEAKKRGAKVVQLN